MTKKVTKRDFVDTPLTKEQIQLHMQAKENLHLRGLLAQHHRLVAKRSAVARDLTFWMGIAVVAAFTAGLMLGKIIF